MADKTFYTRIQQKHDIEANWMKAINFIPKLGEVIVYDIDENHTYERMKIGDGVTNVNNLSFVSTHPDYSENDELAAEYIQNRTHYKYIEQNVYVPNAAYEGVIKIFKNGQYEGSKFCVIDLTSYTDLFNVTLGDAYTIVLDGIEYSKSCTSLTPNTYTFGNEALFWISRNDTGENYCINIDFQNQEVKCHVLGEDVSHTLYVYKDYDRIKQIPIEYVQTASDERLGVITATEKEDVMFAEVGVDENGKLWYEPACYDTYVPIIILPQQTISGIDYGEVYMSQLGEMYTADTFPLKVGERYVVYLNGDEYECEAYILREAGMDIIMLGDITAIAPSDQPMEMPEGVICNGEPFAIMGMVYGNEGTMMMMTKEQNNVVSLKHLVRTVRQVPDACIPDNISRTPDWFQIDPSANDYIKNKPTRLNRIILVDQETGEDYFAEMRGGNLVTYRPDGSVITDFETVSEMDGSYILVDWHETTNGVPSTVCTIPDYNYVII